MRIALFTETYVPDVNGVVTHVKMLKEGLEELGHQVLVVCAKNVKKHSFENGVLTCPGHQLKKIYNYALALPYSKYRGQLLDRFAPDIIHIHNEFGIGLFGLQYGNKRKIPTVYTLHTEYDKNIFYISFLGLDKALLYASHKYMGYFAKKCDVMISPSKKSVDYIRNMGIKKEVKVIPNCVDVDHFLPTEINVNRNELLRSQYNCSNKDVIFTFVGRIGAEKSIDTLLEYWAYANVNAKLWIIGDGPQKEELKILVSKLKIANQVRFLGKINHDDLPQYLHACNYYVSASLSEMHSVSMLEAMASGLFVMQRYDENNVSQIQEGINGYIYKDKEDFRKKIEELVSLDEQVKANKRETTINSIKDNGKRKQASDLLEIYQQLLDEKRFSI